MSKNKQLKKSNSPTPTTEAQTMPNETPENNPETPTPNDAPVIEQSPVVEQRKVTQSTDFASAIEQLKTSGTQAQKSLIVGIESYITKMSPGVPIDANQGAREQYVFWKLISSIAESTPNDEFKKIWNLLLAYFEFYKDTVFHERYIFRFSEYWTWSEDDLNAFQRVINLIKLTSNPTERTASLSHVSIDRSLAVGFSDEARQRIVSFYH